MADGLLMLENLIDGKTVSGKANPFGQPIRFTEDFHTRALTGAALDIAVRIIGLPDDASAEMDFTQFAQKIIQYAQRGGVTAKDPGFLMRITGVAEHVRLRPRLMRHRGGIPVLFVLATPRKRQPAEDAIAEMKAKVLPPAERRIWQSGDGHYQLFNLTHPFHVWEEGMVLDNCLTCLNPYLRDTRVGGDAPADILWALPYWTDIARGEQSLFSLRSGTARIALFSIGGRALLDFSVRFPDEPNLAATMVEVFDFLDRHLSPVNLDPRHLRKSPRTLIHQVRRLRGDKGGDAP